MTTAKDYKKFDYFAYPSNPNVNTFKRERYKLIDKKTKIVSMGSCFARHLSTYLIKNKYNYLITEKPFKQGSAHWERVFNTACIRQIFEYTYMPEKWKPAVRWWDHGFAVQDPFRRDIIYNKDTCEQNFQHHIACSRKALDNAEVLILTLGLTEVWRDFRDLMTFYRVPSPKIYDKNIHEFHLQSIGECITDLQQAYSILHGYNKKVKIIVTVSPVPLFATFRNDVDVMTANMMSKSTLRVVAEYFSQYRDVYYFPAYELVTQVIKNPYKEDNRHPRPQTIAKVMDLFNHLYMK